MAIVTSPAGIKVVLTVIDNSTGAQYTVPVLPTNGEIYYEDGDQQPIALSILDTGAVEIPDGTAQDSIAWDSFFPARHDPAYCSVPASELKAPESYRNLFSAWKDSGQTLQLVCTAAGVNKTMFVKSFKWRYRGFEGDMYYSVRLSEYRPIAPRKVSTGGGQTLKKGPTAVSRPAMPKPAAAKQTTYTVKAGDTLTAIAKKVGVPVNTLAANNKATIPNPNKIYPGQVLTV